MTMQTSDVVHYGPVGQPLCSEDSAVAVCTAAPTEVTGFSRRTAEFSAHARRLEDILQANQQLRDSNQLLLGQLVAANANATTRMDRMEQDTSTLKNLTTRIQSAKYAPDLAADLHQEQTR